MKAIVKAACGEAEQAARLAVTRIAEISAGRLSGGGSASGGGEAAVAIEFEREGRAGFGLVSRGGSATIRADSPREFIAGVGRLLALLGEAAESGRWPDGSWSETPRFPVRVHYMPAHFGNPYEVAWPGEMQRYLEDLALWGSSGYGDWFDPNDMPDPYHPHVYCSASMTLWQRKKDFLRRAKNLGLDTAMFVAHNVGFLDQMRPEWVGQRSLQHRVQGQVLCPSIPAARAVCLKNHENLFADLAESGVRVDKLIYAPYDDGGCACAKCQPYFPTFLKMVSEIHPIARRYFPNIKADLCGWWLTEEETRQVGEFAAGPGREWVAGFQVSVAYEAFGAPDVRQNLYDLPQSIFFHIGYSHDKRDVYLTSGSHSAPRRIQQVIQSLEHLNGAGFVTYNESFGDHFNQFLATRLSRDPKSDLGELTRAYCRQMYGLRGEELQQMAAILQEMEMLEGEKARRWAAALAGLRPRVAVPAEQPWAFEHVALKAELLALDHQIGSGENWRSAEDVQEALPLIARRLALSEKLWRQVYGLGILRHIFVPDFMMPPWHKRYLALHPQQWGRIKPDFVRVSDRA